MKIIIRPDAEQMGVAAALDTAALLNEAIASNGSARLVLSTGASQFETLQSLVKLDVDWTRVEMFHLDEYVNLPITHIASFRKYLQERFVDQLPAPLKAVHFVNGEGDVAANITKLSAELLEAPIDVALVGIGENGHIAFNDPPADLDTHECYKVVTLNDRCRQQQVGEGWFATPADVPAQAISMTVHQILNCVNILSAVPGARKAEAIYNTLTQTPNANVPATMLKTHANWTLYLDENSAGSIIPF